MLQRLFPILLVLPFATALVACSSNSEEPGTSQVKTVTVSWEANREERVNSSGGGYLVYYSQTSGFALDGTGVTVIDVPYASGSSAPTSTQIDLASGTYYFKVVAYSAFPAAATSSEPSAQTSVTVPFL